MTLRKRKRLGRAVLVLALAVAGCSDGCGGDSPDVEGIDAGGDGGDGGPDGDGDADGDSDSDSDTGQSNVLTGTLRDFQESHPDFEDGLGVDPGIVEEDLGDDGKPVYAHGDEGTLTTHGPDAFDQWFRDVEGVNMPMPFTITLEEGDGGVWTYDNQEFFPIDDQLFGNEDNPHNYHFTYEVHTTFTYQGGEVFQFTGDDDLFVFVNGRLGIDLGGVHAPMSGSIDFDAMADDLGIETGHTYPIDFFFAERHTVQSTFRIDTTISGFGVE